MLFLCILLLNEVIRNVSPIGFRHIVYASPFYRLTV